MKKISIVSSCYNEEQNLDELYERVRAVFDELGGKYDFEYILADNGSTDGTANKLRELAHKDTRIKVIINSRNFGHIRSPFHAIRQATGDAVISIASDLQDPPELIKDLIEKWESGKDVILLQKTESEENFVMYNLRRFYYYVLNKITDNGVELAQNCTGSGLFDRKVLEFFKSVDDPYPYFRGLVCEAGFEREYLQFKQPIRKRGITANNFYTLYDMGMTGLVKNSKIPLRIMAIMGFVMSFISLLGGVVYLIWKLLNWTTFSFGIAPIIISIMFISSIQLFCLGVLGEYIGAIYTRVDKKPLVLEKERINF